ncbi:MAG: hypothetical protein A3A94_00360 [Candidatus Portnoybacteria bacterium RIFCSPLOWO2_01_FULL_43_11]|uniref:R3H domain-containing protein n=4 Tax=Candidatus Portnoyibacteriota TaxID=1817913 RepID=A0A1G2FD57_9BACT|nr:MAG: hypothetical protein A2815_00120 [Candidatus Portnoybacteria bacterium RIFCSPHIGHO2_01_FULL_40_12b]OGZ38170.1 MAG: hypothetical protein A3A94_00360 [Candidatus Portnoybacteria bacterium RIFCSPLOWO2_01_FULL_43_11]OGZ38225.1 MAG: hypothetical protein A3E90_02280 [Candidatus Portnoybacteria bacterium RIFCSPHIGHO2_12_FULL_40_11]OGZ40338.1 MAG: hypothetical protein A3I20_00235 [Candidatus Portnoybacteria bacterium RIFCSPLOWO2_02_FULL_40_15]
MNNSEIIKKTIIDLLEKIGFESAVDLDISDKKNITVNIQTNEAGFLIGQAGGNLHALQHLSRVLVNKKLGYPIHFIIDVNNYQKNRIELLKELASHTAEQVVNEKSSLFLQPMPPYERRIVHLALAGHPWVGTESIGQEPNRRIVIKPKTADIRE